MQLPIILARFTIRLMALANAIVMPYVLDFSKSKCSRRLAQLAKACDIGPPNGVDAELANAFIERIREMKLQFNIPSTLAALQRKDIPQIAAAALNEARFTYAVPRYLDKARCEGLIALMLES